MMRRQIAGSFAQYEKARVVAKLRAVREGVRAAKGKCEGRKSFVDRDPELVRQAKALAPQGAGFSLLSLLKAPVVVARIRQLPPAARRTPVVTTAPIPTGDPAAAPAMPAPTPLNLFGQVGVDDRRLKC